MTTLAELEAWLADRRLAIRFEPNAGPSSTGTVVLSRRNVAWTGTGTLTEAVAHAIEAYQTSDSPRMRRVHEGR